MTFVAPFAKYCRRRGAHQTWDENVIVIKMRDAEPLI